MLTWYIFLNILICMIIVLLLYYLIIHQKEETPEDIFQKLILNLKETPVSFTYAKRGTKYENYTYSTEDGQLKKSLDDLPINYDGSFVKNDYKHGNISRIDNGFKISSIDIEFTCPSPWVYKNGRCDIKKICQPNDVKVYRGINYYYFSENLMGKSPVNSEFSYHPRLYYYCNLTEEKLMNCNANELYIGGEKLSSLQSPCQAYDICEDRLEATKHKYQINEYVLKENEYYICNNRKSLLSQCPSSTAFSTISNGCMPVNRCLDITGTLPNNENSFISCLNGEEYVISCINGVFYNDSTNQYSCRNPRCLIKELSFELLPYFRYPNGFYSCQLNSNEPTLTICDDTKILIASPLITQENLPYQKEKYIFPTYEMPKKFMNNDYICEDFNINLHSKFIINNIIDTSFNDGLPDFKFNVITLQIDYSLIPNVFYKNHDKIYFSSDDTVIENSIDYAMFGTSDTFSMFKFRDEVLKSYGSTDYCIYAITYDTRPETPLKSFDSLTEYIDGITGEKIEAPDNFYYNAYTNSFTPMNEAHSRGLEQLAISFIYAYEVVEIIDEQTVILITWTKYGLVAIEGKINENCYVDEDNLISHKTLPKTKNIINNFTGTIQIYHAMLTNIKHKSYNYLHRPICLQWLDEHKILEPPGAVELGSDGVFAVEHDRYYENFDNNILDSMDRSLVSG